MQIQPSPREHGPDLLSSLSIIGTTPDSGPSELSGPPTQEPYSGGFHEPYNSTLGNDISLDALLPQNVIPAYPNLSSFPVFFEQVMLPGVDVDMITNSHETHQPRGVFDFMLDTDFSVAGNDLFGTDFIPDLDRILDNSVTLPGFEDLQSKELDYQESASRRAAAFERSFWQWVPAKNQHAFSEEQRIPLRDGDSISPTHRNRLEALQIPGKLSMQARDDIFKLVVQTAGSRLSVSSFPSSEYLDTLIKIGIGKRTETDAWIHPYTFYEQQLRPELLTGLVAAGCVCCGLSSINKTGIILQEITRASLAQLVEDDNSVLRDLQWLQASMLWLDIGIFCGYKRKMQIAESYLQPLCTAFRRAVAFDRSTYSRLTPPMGDDEVSLTKVWHEWIKQESLKRLAYHLFGHDVEVAMAMNRPALISYTELTLPFPAARDLWLAPTASAWRDLWAEKYRSVRLSDLSLRDLLSDPTLVTTISTKQDFDIARTALLHGLAIQTWEFRQQRILSEGSPFGSRAMAQLWLQSRQDDMYTTLKSLQEETRNTPPVITLLNEFVMMFLHIDVDAIQRFVGKLGELDARRAYPGLREWSRTKEARAGIWHAGQVLRAARAVAAHQLRGFDAMTIYHAALVLWVFGLLQCGESTRHEPHTPLSEQELPPCITLDGLYGPPVRAFLAHGHGRPGLTISQPRNAGGGSSTVFCELSKPRAIMAIARQVLEGNCPLPFPEDTLPPMIQNLCELIEDLGRLP
ncbi:unnamed protein product [Penicillium salamii]|nr:unnamed protein product [Penicillium salamii]CAG8395543.1 unnamed protein product [Penicillium salamii]